MRASPTRSAFALTALCFALTGSGPAAKSQPADDPQYTASGDLVLPTGFETWVFVGSNLGLSYTPDAAAAASDTTAATAETAISQRGNQQGGLRLFSGKWSIP